MEWEINGTYFSPCSCKVGCPCSLGEKEADQGWCSGALVFDIKKGQANGVNLSGLKVALSVDWPGGFLGGDGTAKLYFEPGTSQEQMVSLESILEGKNGGVFEGIAQFISKWLPTGQAPIKIVGSDDQTHITIGDIGEMTIKPLKGANGELTKLLNGAAAFREEIILAKGTGSNWKDPEMRKWESGGHAEMSEFSWKA